MDEGELLYQESVNGEFVGLPYRPNFSNAEFLNISLLDAPLPNGHEIDGVFQKLPLRDVDNSMIRELERMLTRNQPFNNDIYDRILGFLNNPLLHLTRSGSRGTEFSSVQQSSMFRHDPNINIPIVSGTGGRPLFSQLNIPRRRDAYISTNPSMALGRSSRRDPDRFSGNTRTIEEPIISPDTETNSLLNKSYETLLKQLYDLSIKLPEYLIVNDLKVNFKPFSEVSNIQIERYIIDPLLQPWAGNFANRILTLFGKNGMTYLVRARYNQETNQIYPPA